MPQPNQQLKKYLVALLKDRKNRFGSEFYTPTRLLPLRARASLKAKSEIGEVGQENESANQADFKVQQVDVLEGLWHYAVEKPSEKSDKPLPSHVLLIGKPGSGKSTALYQLLKDAAQKAIATNRNDSIRIPVLIQLRGIRHHLQQEDVWTWIQDAIEAEAGLTLPLDALKQWPNWLLLFDGLNEATYETLQSLYSFLQRPIVSTIPTICTTRQLGSGNDLWIRTQLEMLPLNELQTRDFVQKYLPERGDVLLGQLHGRLREVAETPLLLEMLCKVFKETQQIPQSKGELFRKFDTRYDALKGSALVQPDLYDWKSELLQYLGFKMLEGDLDNPTAYLLRVESRKAERLLEEFLVGRVVAPGDKAKKWLKGLQKHYLLQKADNNGYEIEFHHQLFQEYYAAEWLSPQLAERSDEVLKCHYMNYLKWTEPLMMVLTFVESERLAVRLVELALEVDWRLGTKLAGSVQQKFQRQTVELVAKLEMPEWLKIRLLGETQSDKVIPRLIKALVDEDYSIQREAIEALASMGSNEAVNALLRFIRDPECRSSLNIIRALEENGSRAVERGLIALVKEWGHYCSDNGKTPSIYYRETCFERAVETLGEIKSEASVPILLQVLRDSDYTYSPIVEALAKINAPTAIPDLRKSLRSKSAYARRHAAVALGNLEDQQSAAQLRKLLKDENLDVRIEAANALGKLKDKDSIQALLNSVKDRKSVDSDGVIRSSTYPLETHEGHFRCAATSAIGKILSSNQFSHLLVEQVHQDFISVIEKDPDSGLKEKIQDSLKQIRSHHVARELARSLQDSKNYEYDLDTLVEVLGYIGSEAAIPGLIEALENKININASFRAAEALGEIESTEGIPALIKALSHEDRYVRHKAATALGKLEAEAAVPALLKSLKDELEIDYRSSLGGLLCWDLESLLPYEDVLCRSLGQIGGDKVVMGLIEILRSNGFSVSFEILNTLGESGSTLAISILLEALEEDKETVVICAASGIARIVSLMKSDSEKRKVSKQIDSQKILTLLENPKTASSALEIVGELGIDVDASYFLPILRSEFMAKDNGLLCPPLNHKVVDAMKKLNWEKLSIEKTQEIESLADSLLEDKDEEARLYSAYFLTQLGFTDAALILLEFIRNVESEQCDSAVCAVGEVKGLNAAFLMPELSRMLDIKADYSPSSRLSKADYSRRIRGAIEGIQDNCKFYNYDIYQQLPNVPFPSRSPKMPEQKNDFRGANFHGFTSIGGNVTYQAPSEKSVQESATEIGALLDYLAANYPSYTEADRTEADSTAIVQQINQKPELRSRIASALEKSSKEALDLLKEHPYIRYLRILWVAVEDLRRTGQ